MLYKSSVVFDILFLIVFFIGFSK